jgi:hypothetical protein
MGCRDGSLGRRDRLGKWVALKSVPRDVREGCLSDAGGEDYFSLLTSLYPSMSLSVELPTSGSGNLYQVRTAVLVSYFRSAEKFVSAFHRVPCLKDVVFFGRAETEEEAVARCCKKAATFLEQKSAKARPSERVSACVVGDSFPGSRRLTRPQPPRARGPERAAASGPREAPCPPDAHLEARRRARELEMRSTLLGGVLDRVDAWNRRTEREREAPVGGIGKRRKTGRPCVGAVIFIRTTKGPSTPPEGAGASGPRSALRRPVCPS